MASFNSSETGLMAKYSANDTTLMIDGELIFGYAAETMITVSYDNDNVTVTQDPQGTAVASINNKTGATITVNLNETSPSNAKLTELANTRGEFPLDLRTSTIHQTAAHCYISKMPDNTAAQNAGDRAWQIHALNLDTESLVGR